jgi:hypothetical protein
LLTATAGNTDGEFPMLEWTTDGSRFYQTLLVELVVQTSPLEMVQASIRGAATLEV